ncbi:unnamed protein product [Cuscuta campestris]|uniref:CAP-Gly domain-containing protein n=1 Tax=Cuscuta campestris TaxID=132261 RepID=A0A484MTQ2_9ASTE|nr:unnamed protein product [Cuscuta campestris]
MASILQQIPADDSVLVSVTHANIKSFLADVRFYLQMTVEAVKEKLWKKCGTSVTSMCLELYDDRGAKIADLSDDMKPFGFYFPQDGYRLHVIDTDPSSILAGGWMDDTSNVEKYTISEEAYDKLDGTFKKFKEQLPHKHTTTSEAKICDNYMEDLCAHIKVGDRCQVEPGERRGIVKFVGRAETLASGFWLGVQFDEPVGKHDGMVKGKRYFNSPPLHGVMVRPDKVKVSTFLRSLALLGCLLYKF